MVNRNIGITLGIFVIIAMAVGIAFWWSSSSTAVSDVIVDDLGRSITLDQVPTRIVSLAPSVTEILFALDLGETVVGVTDACDYPSEALAIEKVAAFQEFQIEKIVELSPDLVIMDRYLDLTPPGFWLSKLEEVGLHVIVLYAKNLDDVLTNILLVGQATGAQDQATDLVTTLESRVNVIMQKVENISEDAKPRVFGTGWFDGETDPWTSGYGTFADDILKRAGGINIAGIKNGYFQMSLEAIVWADPQIIIVIEDLAWPTPTYDSILGSEQLQNTIAVQNNSIRVIDANLVSRPAPRLVDGLEATAKILHPELFD